jgi:hypothetical protein
MKYNLLNKRKNNKTTSLYHFSTFHTYINCSVFTVSCYYLLKKFTKFTVDPDYKADISSNIQINGMARSDSTINQQSTDTMSVSTKTDKRTYTIQQQNHSETDEYKKKNSNTTLADPHNIELHTKLTTVCPECFSCMHICIFKSHTTNRQRGRQIWNCILGLSKVLRDITYNCILPYFSSYTDVLFRTVVHFTTSHLTDRNNLVEA